MFCISYKLLSEEWNMEDYYEFLKAINQNIVKCYPKITIPALINLFNYSDEELKKALDIIKENTKDMVPPLYPFIELVTLENKIQVPKNLEYNKMDSYKIIGAIISKIYAFQREEVKKLFTEENREITLELLKEVYEGKRDATPFLDRFDKTFGFLINIEAYKGIYTYYRANYLKMLESDFAHRYRLEQTSKLKHEQAYDINGILMTKYHQLPKAGGYFKYLKEK